MLSIHQTNFKWQKRKDGVQKPITLPVENGWGNIEGF